MSGKTVEEDRIRTRASKQLVVHLKTIEPVIGACIGAAWTFGCFYLAAQVKAKETGSPVYKEDRFWAGGLAGCAIFMMYYFF